MMRTLRLFLTLCALACHPRSDVVPERDPPCMGAAVSRLRHRVQDGRLILEQQIERHCAQPGEPESSVEPLTSVPIDTQGGCPAGEPALQVGPEKTLAQLPGVPVDHVTAALQNFATVHGKGSALAFILRCEAQPRWLFVTTNTVQPVIHEFSEAAPPAPVAEVASSGSSETGEPQPAAVRTGTCEEQLTLDGGVLWRGRLLGTGTMPGPSRMTRWLLSRTKDRAELIVQKLETTGGDSRANDQPQGTWQCTSSSAWEGTVSGSRRLVFKLSQPPDGASKALTCDLKTMKLADVDARRVRVSRPAPGEGCNASRWSSPRKTDLQVLACRDGENEEPFFLAAGAGVERVMHDEDVLYDEPKCTGTPPALRLVPLDGGVMTAIRRSEKP